MIKVLQQWVGERTLALPAFSYCYPGVDGEAPIFDPNTTPSVVGSISDLFWREAGVIRSLHPTHSIAAKGPESKWLCSGHQLCDTPCGRGTPFERMATGECSVLMFGARMHTYTLYHTAEDAANLPFLYEPRRYVLRFREAAGAVRTLTMRRQDVSIARRYEALNLQLESEGLLVRRPLVWGELILIPDAARLHCKIVDDMRQDPLLLVHESSRDMIANPKKVPAAGLSHDRG